MAICMVQVIVIVDYLGSFNSICFSTVQDLVTEPTAWGSDGKQESEEEEQQGPAIRDRQLTLLPKMMSLHVNIVG